MKSVAIYLITDEAETPRYVGKSATPRHRFMRHLLRSTWAVSYRILEWVEPGIRWQDRERYWIRYYRRFAPLENISKGGGGIEHTDVTRAKLRYVKSPEHRLKIADTVRLRWRQGFFSAPSPETVERIRDAKNRNRALYVGNAWGRAGRGQKRPKRSPETKRRQAEAAFIGRWKVYQGEQLLGDFESAKEAGERLGIPATTIRWIRQYQNGSMSHGKYAGLRITVEALCQEAA